ncbi:hypothetical protein DTO013E5_8163 [Penicillium roqueforti]|nr:hypothetical protein CBS147354_6520 [Penicillium roqueforti]KAI2739869.1 hypothetical protein DTO012A1_5864 [Penicillium roqueforti]KAI2750813.1 hypothetical protein DTO013F2_4472 [Penicillium roqueforti]KAI3202780.1 hypothetical protein DTO013E5_8163 [Penicillium roqueforti]
MADPISITSLIIDISSIIPRLIAYAKGVRDASPDIRRLSEELFALKGILEHLHSEVEPPRPTKLGPLSLITPEPLMSILQKTNESLQVLLSDIKEPANKFKRVKQKLEWPFTQEQLNTHLTRLERVKSWLILVITSDSNSLQRDLHSEITSLAKSLEQDLKVRNDEMIRTAHEELSRWLAPVSPSSIHLQASNLRANHTGKCAHTVDELVRMSSNDHRLVFAYFYCKFDDTAFQEPVNILGSLLVQLSESIPSVLESIWPLFKATTKSSAYRRPIDIGAIEDAIIKISSGGKRVILLIDAINESVYKEIIIRSLLKISNLAPNLRILITGTANLIPGQHANVIHMNAEIVRDDIDVFIRFRLQQDETLRNLSTRLQDQIWTTILEGADGSFRWTQLSLETLGSLRTAKSIREALQTLPKTLRETYIHILERIPPSDWELSRNALFWLSFSKRSLTLPELSEAVILEKTCTYLDDDLRLVSPQILLDICQGLITQDEFRNVKLSHASIKDFLTSEWIRSSSVRYFSLNHETADQIIMRLSLTYLCLDNFLSGYTSSIDSIASREHEHPFLEYAAQFWATHGGSCSFDDRDYQLVNKFFNSQYLPRRGNFGVWVQALIPEVPTVAIETTNPLYYAASFGLVPIVKAILASVLSAEVDAPGGRYGSTPLFAACWRGNYETAELLLQAGADPYIVDTNSGLTIFSLPKSAEFSRLLATLHKGLENTAIGPGVKGKANIGECANPGPYSGQIPQHTARGNDTEGTEDNDSDIRSLVENPGLAMDFLAVSPLIDPTVEGFKKHILHLYPRLEPALVHRFASEQLRRYNVLVNFQRNHIDAVTNRSCRSGEYCFALGGGESSLQLPKDPSGLLQGMDVSRNSDRLSDMGETAAPVAEFPPAVPIPPVSLFPSQFECPICFQVKKFLKPSHWSKHVQADLQPFTCTFSDCSEDKSFKRKADWVRHETERHRQSEWWVCSYSDCSKKCFRKDNFVQHLVREHKMLEPKVKKSNDLTSERHSEVQRDLDIDRLWEIVEQCRQEIKQTSQESCRFCGNTFDNWKKLVVHMSKHLENLAMSVLGLVQQNGASDGFPLYQAGIAGRPSCD